MNYSRLPIPSPVVFMLIAGGAIAMTPGCASPYKTPGSQTLESTGGTDTSAISTGTDCPSGTEGCDCYGNGTCNADLDCASQLCVNLAGLTGGSAGGAPATGNGGAPGISGDTGIGTTTTGGSQSISSTGGAGMGGNGAMGGAKATGGAPATGGAKSTGGATAAVSVPFWNTTTYSSTGLPSPSNGHHNTGQNCIQCHVSGSSSGAPVWMFGGTVYQANGTTPASNVQIGISDGTNLYTAYSATNGNFWVPASGTISWAKAQVRIRNSNGELTMAGATPAATCNLCHNTTTYPRITAP